MEPVRYNFPALKIAFDRKRGLCVAKICRELGISRSAFYFAIRGELGEVSEPLVRRVIEAIGEDPDKFIMTPV